MLDEKISFILNFLSTIGKEKCIQRDLISIGLSKSILKKYYPEPEKKFKDYRNEKFYYLYDVSKVVEFVKSESFRSDFSKTLIRSDKAKVVSENVRLRNIKLVDLYEIDVEKISMKDLKKRAIRSWEEWNESVWEDSSTEDTKRIMMNFVRHNLTSYDGHLDFQRGRIGTSDMYELLKDKVTNKILEVYPELKQEEKENESK